MARSLRLLPLALALLAAPAGAQAASVSGGAGSFSLRAGPTEANDVVASASEASVTFRDAGAVLSAGPGCRIVSGGGVECPLGGVALQRVDFDLGDGNDRLDTYDLLIHDGRPHPRMTVEAGDGDDEVRTLAFSSDPQKLGVIVRGGSGNDRLRGGGIVEAGEGNDVAISYHGYSLDVVDGGPGDDVVDGGPAPDMVTGGPGNDYMYEGAEVWPVGPGYYPHDDGTLDGGDGDDTMAAGGNQSTITGGPGDDDIISGAVWADGGEGNDTMRGGPLLRGGPGDDRLSGSWFRQSNYFFAGCCGKPDVLEGGPGRDRLEGSTADAVIDGGEGADELVPGSGKSTLSYRSRSEGVRIDLSDSEAGGTLSQEGDRAEPGFDRLEGSAGDDEIVAGPDGVAIDGYLGDDRLVGGRGADVLDGGAHDDVILGAGGDDELDGGQDSYEDPGTGKQVRAKGNDTIDGGPGADTIVPRGGDDFVLAGSGDDQVDLRERAGRFGSALLNHSHIVQMSGADQVWCGRGLDAANADYADAIAIDCELAGEGTPRWRQVKVDPGRALRLTIRCAWRESRPCKGVASLRTAAGTGFGGRESPALRPAPGACRTKPGATLARSRFRIRAGRVNYVHLRLTGSAERLVRRRGCVAVHALLDFGDPHGRDWLATRSLVLKRSGFRIPSGD
ncbi:MAG TPA: calcium-binding protein [Thermoleophilaceae bacterium]|jgi:Ca2+-binding RTX toxin-like protein